MNNHDDISIAPDPVQEELTAYLDGELDAAARAAVEQRLADDEAYRVRLQRMEDAWAMLDVLPRTEVEPSFTQTTVEMVALAAREEVAEVVKASQRKQWIRWIAGSVAVLLAGFVGFAFIDKVTSRENEQLVRDLPVIENVELYRHIDDIEFLKQLDVEGIFTESVEPSEVDDAI